MTSKILLNIPRLCLRGILHPVINTAGPVCSCRHLTSDVASQQNVIQNIFTRKEKDEHSKIIFRTDVTNPGDHEIRHEGLLYTIDRGIFRRISSDDCFNRFKIQVRTFQEACIMIRKPALEVIHAMKNFDPNLPMPKFILYGHLGVGKNMTLLQTMHYAYMNKWCIIQTPWPQQWIERYTEVSKSTHKPGRIDLPMEARAFLCQLKSQNGIVLNDYKTQYRYNWTEREATEIGTPLIELLKFGLQRVKFADDVVGALLKEIKLLASQRKIKVLVVADGINGFFGPTRMKISDKAFKDTEQAKAGTGFLPTSDLSLIDNFKRLLEPDMVNSICVATVDSNLIPKVNRTDTITPQYLLGREGFAALDPFIPIHVTNYSDKEATSMMEYYTDRRWIHKESGKTHEGRKQLMFLSNNNPRELFKVCTTM